MHALWGCAKSYVDVVGGGGGTIWFGMSGLNMVSEGWF